MRHIYKIGFMVVALFFILFLSFLLHVWLFVLGRGKRLCLCSESKGRKKLTLQDFKGIFKEKKLCCRQEMIC